MLLQRCIPDFGNAAFMVQMEATNTCGDNGNKMYCIQTSAGTSTRQDLALQVIFIIVVT